MNDTLTLRHIKYIRNLDDGSAVKMGSELLEVPGVIIQLRSYDINTRKRTVRAPGHEHATVLNNAAADVDLLATARKYDSCLYVGRYANETEKEAIETLRSALYLYAIHYPGLVSGIVNAD